MAKIKPKTNYYSIAVQGCSEEGFFNIYQGQFGHIFLAMGNRVTKLTEQQVLDLRIDVYSLIDFVYEDYLKAYKVQ